MARYFLLIFLLAAGSVRPLTSVAQNAKTADSIVFIDNSWIDALHRAQVQNKYIFVDAYATWCGPCNLLKSTTFKNSKAAAFFNANFISLEMDMERGDGPDLAQRWGIQAYPTLLIFDSNGKPMTGTMGYMGANALIKFGKYGLTKTAE
jgi:thiol:disulfide interchange protein